MVLAYQVIISDGVGAYIVGLLVGSVALLVARRTNDRKVAGPRPTKVVCNLSQC